MNKPKIAGLVIIALSLLSLNVFLQAADQTLPPDVTPELIAKGRDLFNNKGGRLNNKFACILCHKAEKAIEKTKVKKAGENLPAIINEHLTEKSKGTALAPESEEMKALMAYIRYEHSK